MAHPGLFAKPKFMAGQGRRWISVPPIGIQPIPDRYLSDSGSKSRYYRQSRHFPMDATRSHSLDCQVKSAGIEVDGRGRCGVLVPVAVGEVAPGVGRAIDCEILHE